MGEEERESLILYHYTQVFLNFKGMIYHFFSKILCISISKPLWHGGFLRQCAIELIAQY